MDFSRLSPDELLNFLQLHGVARDQDVLLSQQARTLFAQLQSDPGSQYPLPIVDLYLAEEFKKSPEYNRSPYVYTRKYINKFVNTPEERRKIGELIGLDPNDPDFNERFVRIIGILDSTEQLGPVSLEDIPEYSEEPESTPREAQPLEQARLIQGQVRERAQQRLEEERRLERERKSQAEAELQKRQAERERRISKWDQFPQQRSFREITCLTFNVCYQCMLGIKEGSVKRACGDSCRNNVGNYIDANGPYDFIALQEATNWRKMNSNTLGIMIPVEYTPGSETMVTFYRQRLQLDSGVSIIKSYLQDKGRPFIMLFLPGLCVFNLHPGHATGIFTKKYDFYELGRHLDTTLQGGKPGALFTVDQKESSTLTSDQKAQVLDRLRTNQIIMMGDMNVPFKGVHSVKFFQESNYGLPEGRTLTGFHDMATCCDPNVQTTQDNAKSGAYDQILVSQPNLVVDHDVPTQLLQASDHLPVKAKVLIPVELP